MKHAPDSQRRLAGGKWRGKCRCGETFKGDNLTEFLAAWKAHDKGGIWE